MIDRIKNRVSDPLVLVSSEERKLFHIDHFAQLDRQIAAPATWYPSVRDSQATTRVYGLIQRDRKLL
jgi:hypothetical protein